MDRHKTDRYEVTTTLRESFIFDAIQGGPPLAIFVRPNHATDAEEVAAMLNERWEDSLPVESVSKARR